MWSYYGSKSKIIHLYPRPKHDLIIEPFAGTARYALRYFDRNVIIMEKYDKIYLIWKYLQQASIQDILSLPDIGHKQKVPIYLSDEEKWLIGFSIAGGVQQPALTAGLYNGWNRNKKKISENLHKIRHWSIRKGDYSELENQKATWFIDPPYQKMGIYYKESSKKINFCKLKNWVISLNGQVMVCENITGDWLPFRKLIDFQGGQKTNTEAIWTNASGNLQLTQLNLF